MFRTPPLRVLVALASSSVLLLACPTKDGEKNNDTKATDSKAMKAATSTSSANAPIELPPGDGPVATVNGVAVPREPFNKEYKMTIERYQKARHEVQPALRERLKDNIVRRLVDAELIRQQAEKLGVAVPDKEREEQWAAHKKRYGSEEAFAAFLQRAGTTAEDVRSQFESNLLREKVFAKVSESIAVSPADSKDFFEKNQQRYDEPEQVQASHILIRVPQNASAEEKAQKKARAEEALKKAKGKGADFAALAKEYGEDPTKDRGGDLGYFTKGRMVKPFEDAVWPLKNGQISNVVETQFGFHVIKKVDHKKSRKKPFDEVKDQIQKSLEAKKRNESIRDALQKWKADAKIEIFVKGDEKVMSEGQRAPGAAGGLMQQHAPSKVLDSTGGLKIQRLAPPETRDHAAGSKPAPH